MSMWLSLPWNWGLNIFKMTKAEIGLLFTSVFSLRNRTTSCAALANVMFSAFAVESTTLLCICSSNWLQFRTFGTNNMWLTFGRQYIIPGQHVSVQWSLVNPLYCTLHLISGYLRIKHTFDYSPVLHTAHCIGNFWSCHKKLPTADWYSLRSILSQSSVAFTSFKLASTGVATILVFSLPNLCKIFWHMPVIQIWEPLYHDSSFVSSNWAVSTSLDLEHSLAANCLSNH